jgi:hypothetical protein
MVQTVKFSQFLIGGTLLPTDIVVGLRSGKNYQFDAPGPGAGIAIITQDLTLYPLTVGKWVRVNFSSIYVPALADSAEDAEVVGVVIEIIDPMHFAIQQVGYITTAQGVFTGLTPSIAYFLSPTTPGLMINTDVNGTGQVSKPVFVPDTPTSGWVLDYRGLIVSDESSVICPCPYTGIVTIIQTGHGFSAGQFVRLNGSVNYVLAKGDNLGNSQEVGVVAAVLNSNSFILQFSGYNLGAVSKDDANNPIVASSVYYLSTSVAGAISTTNPSTGGNISRPVYISEQVYGTTGINAGYVLNQRSLNLANFGTGSNDFPMALLFGR